MQLTVCQPDVTSGVPASPASQSSQPVQPASPVRRKPLAIFSGGWGVGGGGGANNGTIVAKPADQLCKNDTFYVLQFLY